MRYSSAALLAKVCLCAFGLGAATLSSALAQDRMPPVPPENYNEDQRKAADELGVQTYAVDTAPSIKTHPVRAARIAFMHTWMSTQAEGWWRLEFDWYVSSIPVG